MNTQSIERLALSMIKGMTAEVAVKINEIFGDLHEFFRIDTVEASKHENLSLSLREMLASRARALKSAEEEMRFIMKHNIRMLNILDSDVYPYRLAECPDAPINLFLLGDADLNAEHILAVVGTRRATAYGLTYTERIIEQIKDYSGQTTIVSGLAYGIDKAAHQAALKSGLPTIAVVAHGLGMIYPAAHRNLASDILKAGGAVITEYVHDVKPYRPRFLERNRVIAGVSDAVLVSESPFKSGSLNTAAHARAYNREVFALPGRASDENSKGCNKLIAKQLALLATEGNHIAEALHWEQKLDNNDNSVTQQPSLFESYEGNEATVYNFLKEQLSPVLIDVIASKTGLSVKDVMVAVGEMQMDGVVERHPGARYSLI